MIDIPSGYDWYDGSKVDDLKNVEARRPRRSQRWRHIGDRRVRVMKKLDQSKVEYIVAEKRKGTKNHAISESMGITVRYVQKLWARFKNTPKGKIVFPAPMGRPSRGTPTRSEQSAVLTARRALKSGASRLWDRLKRADIVIPKGVVHAILRESGDAVPHKRKQGRRKWIRYERKHTNSMWHTDYKQLDDGRWLISYEDDASRFVTGWGVFDEATAEHAIEVLDKAISEYGKPRSILSDRGSQFYATESEKKSKGVSEFEKHLEELGIRHILARVAHPQTNGKLERVHGEIQRKLPLFYDVAGPPGSACPINPSVIESDPMVRFMKWYNYERPHMSLDTDIEETPAMAFERKMLPPGSDVSDE